METGEKAESLLSDRSKLYQQRACLALPILVRQAIAHQPIFYADLAAEIGMENPRNLNFVLGCIGKTIQELSQKQNKHIPFINCLACNQTTGLPGMGVDVFISEHDFKKLTAKQQRGFIDTILYEIYSYPDWYEVLKSIGLKSQPNNKVSSLLKSAKSQKSTAESQFHLNLKNYICSHPNVIKLPERAKGQTEYNLPSGDTADILFQLKKEWIGVEVKSRISDEADILRGLFQCVKYQALMEADQKIKGYQPNCQVILALENELPKTLLETKNILGIEVIDKITIPQE